MSGTLRHPVTTEAVTEVARLKARVEALWRRTPTIPTVQVDPDPTSPTRVWLHAPTGTLRWRVVGSTTVHSVGP